MKQRLVFLVALAYGALFLWSGVVKVRDPLTFAESIRNFRIVGDPFVAAFAHFVPWLEIFAGIAVMWDRTREAAAALLAAMVFAFTLAIVSAWMRGFEIACGCFGGEEITNYPVKVVQNLALVACGVFLWYGARRSSVEKP